MTYINNIRREQVRSVDELGGVLGYPAELLYKENPNSPAETIYGKVIGMDTENGTFDYVTENGVELNDIQLNGTYTALAVKDKTRKRRVFNKGSLKRIIDQSAIAELVDGRDVNLTLKDDPAQEQIEGHVIAADKDYHSILVKGPNHSTPQEYNLNEIASMQRDGDAHNYRFK